MADYTAAIEAYDAAINRELRNPEGGYVLGARERALLTAHPAITAMLDAHGKAVRQQIAQAIAKRAETFRGFCVEAGDITRAEVWDSAAKLARDELPAAACGDIAANTETTRPQVDGRATS